jgi:hypothetical protein
MQSPKWFRSGRFSTMIALAMCAMGLAGYLSEVKVSAQNSCGVNECVYADQCYSNGACLGSQYCNGGSWVPDHRHLYCMTDGILGEMQSATVSLLTLI